MHRWSIIFVVISVIGAALIYNLTTFEVYAQGGIIGLTANGAQDVYLTENPEIKYGKIPYQRPPVETPSSNPSSVGGGCGGIMCLIPNSAQDVYLTGAPSSNPSSSAPEQSPPFTISGDLKGPPNPTLAVDAQPSCSEDQVLDEQSGFCVPKQSETAEGQQVVGAEEKKEQTEPEQPDQQTFDNEGDSVDENSNDEDGNNDGDNEEDN
jgi:hypothetical protein